MEAKHAGKCQALTSPKHNTSFPFSCSLHSHLYPHSPVQHPVLPAVDPRARGPFWATAAILRHFVVHFDIAIGVNIGVKLEVCSLQL